MTSLLELQTRILDALLDTAPADSALALIAAPGPAAPAAGPPGLSACARLAVYRDAVRGNFAAALQSTYPAVRRLVGEDYFHQLARNFGTRHPSASGDLRHAGERFPAYLAELHRDDEYGYLGEVARLEWLIQDVLLAAECPPLELGELAKVPPGAYETLQFLLHPALRLFTSRYPAQRIWDSNVNSDAEPDTIDLASGGDRLAVLRQRLQLQFHALTRAEAVWLSALQSGEPLAASIAAAAGEGEFDAAAALRRFVALGIIVGCQ